MYLKRYIRNGLPTLFTMDRTWRHRRSEFVILKLLFVLFYLAKVESCENTTSSDCSVDSDIKNLVDEALDVDDFSLVPGLQIEKITNVTRSPTENANQSGRSAETIEEYVNRKLDRFTETHVVSVNFGQTARFFSSGGKDTGKSSFLAGFGMGILAFFLKKLLLPVYIGGYLAKSVLLAMFLPSLLGGVGKLVGKGLSTVSGLSGASGGIHAPQQHVEDFEFKDTDPYNNDGDLGGDDFSQSDALGLNTVDSSTAVSPNSRLGFANNRIYTQSQINDNYYMRKPNKKTDYKVFHKIPSSSLLLTSYDPFYSPLLSRLDAVFQQFGLGNEKSTETEKCRERLVCLMYANPAKYAPYSNLVSAQLSRELNELRKPASDNPEILRFFKYMKAAKDGQDGEECLEHGGCPHLTSQQPSPALLTTYNEINKLVQARKLKK